jgi:hypothetical protein
MVTHMKTTIEIADGLLEEAKKVAAREGTTLRALVEAGLRATLRGRRQPAKFRLRVVTFKGDGMRAELGDGAWERLRDIVYEGRGA